MNNTKDAMINMFYKIKIVKKEEQTVQTSSEYFSELFTAEWESERARNVERDARYKNIEEPKIVPAWSKRGTRQYEE